MGLNPRYTAVLGVTESKRKDEHSSEPSAHRPQTGATGAILLPSGLKQTLSRTLEADPLQVLHRSDLHPPLQCYKTSTL